jgi:hypothetical protein
MLRGPETQTVEFCRRRTQDDLDKANCLREAAVKANASAVCGEISDAQRNERNHCFSELGIKQTKMELCLKIDAPNDFLIGECVKAAMAGPDKRYRQANYCASLKPGSVQSYCLGYSVPYRKSATPCSGIQRAKTPR